MLWVEFKVTQWTLLAWLIPKWLGWLNQGLVMVTSSRVKKLSKPNNLNY